MKSLKFNQLKEALEKAQVTGLIKPKPIILPAPPKESPQPLKKVVGGDLVRTPVNKQAAMVIRPAGWLEKIVYRDEPPPVTMPHELGEAKAEIKRLNKCLEKLLKTVDAKTQKIVELTTAVNELVAIHERAKYLEQEHENLKKRYEILKALYDT